MALNLPDATRRAVWSAAEPVRRRDLPVSWVRPDGIHLTLKFLGETDDDRAPELNAALRRAAQGARPLPLVLQGFGAFPGAARPRVLWVGIEPEPALELLQNAVEREFAPLGFPTDVRPFRPHVTIGRVKRDAKPGAFTGLEATLEGLAYSETVVIDTVDLMRSTLGPGGSTYTVQHAERLS